MKKKIQQIEEIINDNRYDGNAIELYSNDRTLHTLLCNKRNGKYCVEVETDEHTTLMWYDMSSKEDVDELLEILSMKYN